MVAGCRMMILDRLTAEPVGHSICPFHRIALRTKEPFAAHMHWTSVSSRKAFNSNQKNL